MGKTGKNQTTRREFLQVGATSAALTLAGNAASVSAQAPGSSSQRSKKMATFDAHSHMLMGYTAPDKEFRSLKDLTNINLPDLMRKWDEVGIEKVVCVVQETMRIWKDWTGTNELIIDLHDKYPDRFIGIFGAEPLTDRNRLNKQRLKEFKAAAEKKQIGGIWFGPPYCHFHANDRRVYPFYEVATENDIVAFYHHGGGIGGGGGPAHRAPVKYARPLNLDDVVIDFPDLRIHVEHMAYPYTEELFAIMKHAPNMYTDVCELFPRPTWLAWYLMMAKEYGVIDRVVWGSDFDIYWYDDFKFERYFDKVDSETSWIRNDLNRILQKSGWPTMTQKDIDGMLGANAKKLWKV